MPILTPRTIQIRPIVAETGPIGVGTPAAPPPSMPPAVTIGKDFLEKHKLFIEEVNALNHCFGREEIHSIPAEEVEGHIQVALQDNFVVEDHNTGRFCTGQVAWELKTRTQGYVYRRL